jgi:hypothetical protein
MAIYVAETPIQLPPDVLAPGKRALDVKQFPQIDLPSKLPRRDPLMCTFYM